MITINQKITQKRRELETAIQNLTCQIEALPDGTLYCKTTGNYTKWYVKSNNGFTYLHKKCRTLAESLALKKYLLCKREDLLVELNAINSYLDYANNYISKADSLLNSNACIQTLLLSHFDTHSQSLMKWRNEPFETNDNYPENLLHKSISGNLLRSKSEVIIDLSLFLNKIPFRYECALYLGQKRIFPDFTIYHPEENKIYYWEHFGMMDNATYASDAFHKLQLYSTHNIIPSINLITTFETKDNPLTSDMVDKIIHHYFL